MSIFSAFSKIEKNKSKFYSICENLILEYEKDTAITTPSSKNDVMLWIKNDIETSSDIKEFFSDSTIDYNEYANIFISRAAFSLLTSGTYHIHYGVLNPMGIAKNLKAIYNCAILWALNNGKISEKQKEEQYNLLMEGISQVG